MASCAIRLAPSENPKAAASLPITTSVEILQPGEIDRTCVKICQTWYNSFVGRSLSDHKCCWRYRSAHDTCAGSTLRVALVKMRSLFNGAISFLAPNGRTS